MKKRIITCFLLLILSLILIIGYARFIEPNLLTVRTVDVNTNMSIKPCKIVFFTDTHFGKYYDEHHVEKIVRKINEANADFVIFGGDLIDNYARDRENIDLDYLKNELGKIKANTGKFAVWGNHDYGGGAVRIYEDLIVSSGFEILKNESRILEEYGLKLVGYDDYLMGYTDPSLYKTDSGLFQVIAAHEPIVSQFIENETENFLLSGHTHGGQVSLPFLTAKFLPEGSGQFVKGFYTKKELDTTASVQMYTSSGIGMTRYPFRFLNIPEIVEVNLLPSD